MARPTTPHNNIDRIYEAEKHVPAPTMAPDCMKPFDIGNLMSPPEADKLDTFSVSSCVIDDKGALDTASWLHCISGPPPSTRTPRRPAGPLSPPVSPKETNSRPVVDDDIIQDPILYPSSNDTPCTASRVRYLFSDSSPSIDRTTKSGFNIPSIAFTASNIVSNHVTTRTPHLFRQVPPPHNVDYGLVLYLKAEVMAKCLVDRRGWLQKERQQLVADRVAAATRKNYLQPSISGFSKPSTLRLNRRRPRAPYLLQEVQQSSQLQRYEKQSTSLRQARKVEHSVVIHPALDRDKPRVTKRASRTTPTLRENGTPVQIAPYTEIMARRSYGNTRGNLRLPDTSPEPRIRTVAPNREDKDFQSLPDYCPPLNTLPGRTNNLKVDWKGNALDLSCDPYQHLLHRDEINLAACLRLDCATYLTSKRRIFARRLECARIGKEFRKTDAQQACKIDVNKASKLWTAYDKVGWLRVEHMRLYM